MEYFGEDSSWCPYLVVDLILFGICALIDFECVDECAVSQC
jgi:hypothetical protein